MELWVRSQDKECLTNISNIQYVYKNNMHGLGTYYDNLKILGTYKTKERTLEVLDEIQNILKPTIITTGYECELKENIKDKTSFNLDMIPTKTEIQELSTVVYQMPED